MYANGSHTQLPAVGTKYRNNKEETLGEHQFEVLSTNGDSFLSGEDFDKRYVHADASDDGKRGHL